MSNFPGHGFTPWTLEDLDQLSRAIGKTLPDSLVKFLREYGGGDTEMRIVPGTSGNGMVGSFYDADGLLASLEDPYIWIPSDYLEFGYGAGGGLCVEVGDRDVDRVFWADYDLAEQMGLGEGERAHEIMRQLYERFGDFVDDFDSWEII